MLTLIMHLKKIGHRVMHHVLARLTFTVTAFNLLVQWWDLNPDSDSFIPLSVTEFNL